MGAVTSTFIAGVEAIKRGIAKPIGSVTQMATIRLGKRTDNNGASGDDVRLQFSVKYSFSSKDIWGD